MRKKRAQWLISVALFPLLILVIALGTAGPAYAGPIAIGGLWYEFAFGGTGSVATGCAPADPAGPACVPSSGGNSIFADAPPWTFDGGASSVDFTITDAFLRGDAFDVYDFGALVGSTPLVPASGSCGDDPVPCLADPAVSHAVLTLAPGPHSITIIASASPYGSGAAYFRADLAVPEPGSLFLLGSGLLGLAFFRRRKTGLVF